ncbi:MAG TPA: endolytic transglycosylase MltG [Roseiarcus sp.]|nr:endolytic transglycosylase MltG [Roseiarcus sp.]
MLVGALLAIGAVAWLMMESRKPGPLTADKIVNIVREDDGGSIAEQLERAGVIDSATWFSLLTLLDGNRSGLKRGEYEFKAGVSMNDIETLLAAHHVVQHKLTVPEGLTSEQIVQRLRDDDVLVGDIKETPREGSLMPDTYYFERGFTRQSLLTRMAKAQTKIVDEIWKGRAPDLPIKSPGEMVTLASIVEKETGKADERPRVAGVFVNRLQKHMRLESDPTIVYGLVFGKGTLGHSITKAEVNQVTPYNTYIIDGLPPGPISNPGKAALEAVANPLRSRDLYFVADGTGGHVFADSFEQHLKNVAHWRQIEKDAKDRLAPDATPPSAPAVHGALESADPASFGKVTAPTASLATSAVVLAHLAKIGASRNRLDAALASLSSAAAGAKTMEELGAVVAGVNDAPAEGDAFADQDSAGTSDGSIASVPLSPAMLTDQKAREAKYGAPELTPSDNGNSGAAPLAQPSPSGRPRIYDASEGTKLDPLLNKTYDLSYAKVVPDLSHQ